MLSAKFQSENTEKSVPLHTWQNILTLFHDYLMPGEMWTKLESSGRHKHPSEIDFFWKLDTSFKMKALEYDHTH